MLRERAQDFLRLLAPAPGRLEFAARVGVICILTMLVTEIYQTPDPALTTYIVFFVVKPDRTSSVVLSLTMLVVITLTIGLLIPLSILLINVSLWRVAAMVVFSFMLLFASSSSKLQPVGNIVALIVIYALDLLTTVPDGETATRTLLYTWLFVGIPAGMSLVVNLVMAPAPRSLAQRALAIRLGLAAAMLRDPTARTRRSFKAVMAAGTGGILEWLQRAGMEKSSLPADLAALRQATDSIAPVLLLTDLIDRDPDRMLPQRQREIIAQTLGGMAAIFQAGGYPVEVKLENDAEEDALSPSAAAIFDEFQEVLGNFAVPPSPPTAAAPKKKSGFFRPDAFTNPDHVYYALKGTLAAMFCYIVYTSLNWRGIHTCLITCYIVALGTAGETVEKLSLRLLGCVLGASTGLAAIVFLMPNLDSIGALMIVVFLFTLPAAWIAAGGPRIAYAGLQMAFAFYLCVLQGPTPAFDMTVARDRIIGILFGNFVVYLVFMNVWPVSVVKRIDPAIVSMLRQLSGMVKAASWPERRALATQAQAALSAVVNDISVAQYEPSSIRPPEAWLRARRRTALDIAALEGPLLLTTNQAPSLCEDIAHRLDRLADSLGTLKPPPMQTDGQSPPSGALPPPEALTGDQHPVRQLIETHLESLEQVLAQRQAEEGATNYAPV